MKRHPLPQTLLRKETWITAWQIPVITTILILEVLSWGLFSGPPNIISAHAVLAIFIAVAYTAFRGGVVSGVIGSVIGTVYLIYAAYVPEMQRPFAEFLQDRARSIFIVNVAFVVMAALIGYLRGEVRRLLGRERAAHHQAERNREWLEAVVQQMPSGVVIAEAPSGKIVLQNDRIDEIERRPPNRAKDVPEYVIYEGYYPDGRVYEPNKWPLARSIQTGETVQNEEIYTNRGDGTRGVVRVSSTPIRDASGDIVAAVAVVEDITAQKELEQRKDEFIGLASHELKTPITSMKIFLQVLRKRFPDDVLDPDVMSILDKLDSQVERLSHLVSELLDVSRIQSGRFELHRTHFCIDKLIEEAVESIQPTLEKHKIIVRAQPHTKILADKDRIEQVLINLITNAVKYSPDADTIVVRVSQEVGMAVVSVQDFGVGVDQKFQGKLFDRFYQVPQAEEGISDGLGMGLHISKEIVERHGGKIWITSEKGKGATFTFSLPVQ